MKLTGKCRYRSTFFGKLVLQVQYHYEHTSGDYMDTRTITSWRDAKTQDLTVLQAFEVSPND